jgi:hypothetical protein
MLVAGHGIDALTATFDQRRLALRWKIVRGQIRHRVLVHGDRARATGSQDEEEQPYGGKLNFDRHRQPPHRSLYSSGLSQQHWAR